MGGYRAGVAAAVCVIGLVVAGCGTSAPPPPPTTVSSVDGWGLLTLSTGDRVYDTGEPTALGPAYDQCETDYLLRAVRTAIAGRQVTRLKQSSNGPYGTAPAGYVPVNISVAGVGYGGRVQEDHDYWTEAQDRSGDAAAACEPPETATSTPTTTAESAPSDTDVDVDVDQDDDGESRFCRRRWYC